MTLSVTSLSSPAVHHKNHLSILSSPKCKGVIAARVSFLSPPRCDSWKQVTYTHSVTFFYLAEEQAFHPVRECLGHVCFIHLYAFRAHLPPRATGAAQSKLAEWIMSGTMAWLVIIVFLPKTQWIPKKSHMAARLRLRTDVTSMLCVCPDREVSAAHTPKCWRGMLVYGIQGVGTQAVEE